MGFIRIGDTQFNIEVIDGITKDSFKKRFEFIYKRIGKGKDERISADYAELKKHFTKKDKPSKKKEHTEEGED